jgi:hypothetical protein
MEVLPVLCRTAKGHSAGQDEKSPVRRIDLKYDSPL